MTDQDQRLRTDDLLEHDRIEPEDRYDEAVVPPEIEAVDPLPEAAAPSEIEAVDRPAMAADAPSETTNAALLATTDAEHFRSRWNEIQASFVDEPRQAVGQADGLVAELMRHLAELFSTQRSQMEADLGNGDSSTEDLRMSLMRYRSFFNRLLQT